jgi:hypothetical protein
MNEIALPSTKATSQGTVVEQTRAAAEVAAAVSVARNFPREPAEAEAALKNLCSRLPVAERAFYEVPNRGAGLSVHIARELARIWGNVDYGVRELARDDIGGQSEMTVWAWDQEQNVRSSRSFIQPHAKSTRQGRKALTDLNDIYLNNQNTGARAVRECIFTVLPGWFVADAEAALRSTLEHGEGKPLNVRCADAVARFAGIPVTQSQLEERIGKPLAKWEASDLGTLTRIFMTITQDGISVKEFFPEKAVSIPALDPAHPDFQGGTE